MSMKLNACDEYSFLMEGNHPPQVSGLNPPYSVWSTGYGSIPQRFVHVGRWVVRIVYGVSLDKPSRK